MFAFSSFLTNFLRMSNFIQRHIVVQTWQLCHFRQRFLNLIFHNVITLTSHGLDSFVIKLLMINTSNFIHKYLLLRNDNYAWIFWSWPSMWPWPLKAVFYDQLGFWLACLKITSYTNTTWWWHNSYAQCFFFGIRNDFKFTYMYTDYVWVVSEKPHRGIHVQWTYF